MTGRLDADTVVLAKSIDIGIAVDVPGCNTVASSGMKASQKKLCFLVDFQTRANEFYIEALKRVHGGALGDFAFGESSYHAGIPWKRQIKYLQDDPKNPENRLRQSRKIVARQRRLPVSGLQ